MDQPYRESADSAGNWSVDVELRRGRNQFDITALDPDTGKTADTPARVFITVPFNVVEAPTLTVDSPAEGAQFENGAIPVKGSTTNAKTVAISAYLTGAADGAPATSPRPSGPAGAPDVGPQTVNVDSDGSFDSPLDLAAGKWQIVVTATSAEGKSVALTRNVSIKYKGVNLVVEIKGSRAWLKVWVDGKVSRRDRRGGARLRPGQGRDVHRQGLHRGPDGEVERDLLHAQRRGPGADVEGQQSRDLAVRATRRSGPDRPDLTWPTRWSSSPSACRRGASARGLTVATAESCTGGLVAHLITEVPGSSGVPRGRDRGVLERGQDRGSSASRRTCSTPMARCRRRWRSPWPKAPATGCGADLGVGVTGVAGPDGGTEAKPVGLVYVAVAGLGDAEVRRFLWPGDRSENKRDSAPGGARDAARARRGRRPAAAAATPA